MKILVINPGSTSTKMAVYEDETPILLRNITHTPEELAGFSDVIEQQDLRRQLVIDELRAADIPLDFDGDMGVPITFLDKYNPDQFDIIGLGIANLGIECGVPPNQLRQGFGTPICIVLLSLVDKVIQKIGFSFKPPKLEEKRGNIKEDELIYF